MHTVKRIVLALSLLLSCSAFAHHTSVSTAPASPWFTGPLLAPTGHVFPKGRLGFEPYIFYTDDFGHYDARWKKVSTLQTRAWNPVMVIFYGLTSRSDLQINVPYFVNSRDGVSNHGFGDLSIVLGYQVLQDVPHTAMPDLKVTLAESFPTGRFDNLNPSLHGVDATGAGSFQTALAATFQKLWYMPAGRFLRARWNFTYTIPAKEHLHGLNAYGGALNTNGTIDLGNHFSTDLAFEYTLTRHWVPAIDFLYVDSGSNRFTGIRGTTSLGLPATISTSGSEVFSLAPALEYNFNGSLGIIAGVWFSITGRDATDFVSGVMALDVVIS